MRIRVQDPKILPPAVLLHDYRVSTMFPFVFQSHSENDVFSLSNHY